METLQHYSERLPGIIGRPDMEIKATFIRSSKFLRLQLCDLLMGAAGSHGNRMHLLRKKGQWGMSANQEARHQIAKYIYDRMREIVCEERGQNAFNWFESTGWDNSFAQAQQSIRIWKFRPIQYQIDRGWQNKQLGTQHRYRGPDIIDPPSQQGI